MDRALLWSNQLGRCLWLLLLFPLQGYRLACIDLLAQRLDHERRRKLQHSVAVLRYGVKQAEELELKLGEALAELSTAPARRAAIATFEQGMAHLRQELLTSLGEDLPGPKAATEAA